MYVDPQKARQERERQERERQAKIQAEKERKAKIKAEEERKAKAERDRKARIKAEEERKAKLKAEQKDPDKKTTQAKKADPKLEAQKPIEPKTEGKKPQAEKKPDDKSQTEITWSKPGQTNPIYGNATPLYGSSAPLYEQPSVPIAKQSEPKPKKPDDRKARTWTGEEPDPVVIAVPHSIHPSVKEQLLATDFEGFREEQLLKKEQRKQAKQAKLEQAASDKTDKEPHSIHPSVKEQLLATDFEGFKAEQLLKKEQRKQAKQAKLEQAASDKTAQEQNGQTHPTKGASRFPAPLLSDLLASPTLNLSTPEVPMFGGIGSVEPTLVAGPPQYSRGWDFEAITSKPMRRNIDIEVAALQQKYKIKDAQFFRHLVQMRQEQIQKQQAVLQHVSNGGNYHNAAQIYGYNGINPGTFNLTNHTQNPETGNHNYGVSFDPAAAKYYNNIAGVEWVKWNQEKARIATAELQGERNAREFIAKLPNASAQDREQLEQVKRRQKQMKQYDASLRQHQAKHERMAANAPVEKLNFNNQYVVPGSLSQLSQAQQPQPQAILPPQSSTSHNPFSLNLPGTQQGEEAGQYWANLYVQGEQQGGLGGFAKQAVAGPLGMLSSLWTKDTALQTTLMLGTAGLGAAAGAGRLGAASLPVVRGLQIGGAFQSGTSIGQGISGKDMWTGEELSPLDRGFHLTFGAVGGAFDLGGSGLRLGNLGKSFPTVTNALEGVSAPQVMRTGGRLGVSTEGGSIKLGGNAAQPPKGTGRVEPDVTVPKATVTVVKPKGAESEVEATVPKPKAKAKPKNEEVTSTTVDKKASSTKADEGKGRTRSAKKEDKKSVSEEQEKSSCTNAGHKYAKEVLPGGTGRAFAGHGMFRYGTAPKAFTVNDGSALSLWTKPDISLPDRLGRLIEVGDHDKLSALFSRDERVQELLTGAATYLPGSKIPNYTLSAPTKLRIHENSFTTEDSKTLSELMQPNSGHWEWAACTEFPGMGR